MPHSKHLGYQAELRELQIGLVRYQQWMMKTGGRALIIFEGRDGAGKDGSIKRITEHLAPRNTHAVSLPKPSDREATQWYFQRYIRHLPAAGDLVIFNRSWYNRAGVEVVMGFCTPQQHQEFLRDVIAQERMLEESGIRLIKLWLDISKDEQAKRLDARRDDPLKQLKVSNLDAEAQRRWKDYSKARNEMLQRTSTPIAPWICVHTDHKKQARLNVMRHLLHTLAPDEIHAGVAHPDPTILYPFDQAALKDGRLEK